MTKKTAKPAPKKPKKSGNYLPMCPRCAGSHTLKIINYKSNLPLIGGIEVESWAMCPKTKEPILFKKTMAWSNASNSILEAIHKDSVRQMTEAEDRRAMEDLFPGQSKLGEFVDFVRNWVQQPMKGSDAIILTVTVSRDEKQGRLVVANEMKRTYNARL